MRFIRIVTNESRSDVRVRQHLFCNFLFHSSQVIHHQGNSVALVLTRNQEMWQLIRGFESRPFRQFSRSFLQ